MNIVTDSTCVVTAAPRQISKKSWSLSLATVYEGRIGLAPDRFGGGAQRRNGERPGLTRSENVRPNTVEEAHLDLYI